MTTIEDPSGIEDPSVIEHASAIEHRSMGRRLDVGHRRATEQPATRSRERWYVHRADGRETSIRLAAAWWATAAAPSP